MIHHTDSRNTIGIDLGDKWSHVCVLDPNGEVVEEGRVRTKPKVIESQFRNGSPALVAIEAGKHSHWVDRALKAQGHEVLVANPRKVSLITKDIHKSDRLDAEKLARLARVDPKLLSPITHRGEEAQADLAIIRARNGVVGTRSKLVNMVRGMVKSFGGSIPGSPTTSFVKHATPNIPDDLRPGLEPVLELIDKLNTTIREYERTLEILARDRYPEFEALTQVQGVGTLTALAFILCLEDPSRFPKSRDVGPFLGLVPKHRESGDTVSKDLGITKAGDGLLRKLLTQSAHYILGPFAEIHGHDSDLRRHGERIAGGGGRGAKKRAVVAVARKLSVLLHRLWVTREVYEPLRNNNQAKGGTVRSNNKTKGGTAE